MSIVDLSPPSSLPASACQIWQVAIGALAANGTLSAELLAPLERYCAAVARWREAEGRLAEEGVIVKAPRSGVPMVNPWHSIARTAAAEAGRLERELALTPLRRASAGRAARPLQADGTPAPLSAMERLFLADADE